MTAELALRDHLAKSGLLDRFEGRAIEWAEQAGIRWIELEGEPWTLVSELERKKGVEAEDFRKHAELVEAPAVLGRVPPNHAVTALDAELVTPDESIADLEKRWGISRNALKARAKALGVELIRKGPTLTVWPGDRIAEADRLDAHLKSGGVMACFVQDKLVNVLSAMPGVKFVSYSKKFNVRNGLAIGIGGPDAKKGITAIIKRQIPEWALAGYTLVNVPLALSYLMHGRSEVAKATRDLTIGTTIDVGKAAAEKVNAPIAVQQFSGDAEVAALMSQLMAKIHERAMLALDTSTRAEAKADRAEAKADQAINLVLTHSPPRLSARAKQPTTSTRKSLYVTWRKHYEGICPCCHTAVDAKNLEIDHWTTRNKADAQHLWLICRGCNTRLGKPELDGGHRRNELDRKRFSAFQENLNLPRAVQGDLDLCA